MAQFIKVGDTIINLANVTSVTLWFNSYNTVRLYFNSTNGGDPDWVQFTDDEADMLRRYLIGVCIADVML